MNSARKRLRVVHAYMQRTEEEVRNSCEEALTEGWVTFRARGLLRRLKACN